MSKYLSIAVAAAFLVIAASILSADPPSLATDKSADPTVIWLKGAGNPDETTVTLTVTAVGDPQIQYFPVDVILIMDRSGSMEGQKLNDAKIAAMYFCSLLGYDLDQSGLVSFSYTATLDQELTDNHYLTIVAINQLVAGGGTGIGYGIQVAHGELDSSRQRSEAIAVMVLLSDGDHNSGPDPVTAANLAKAEGIIIYAIGLGDQVNEQLMREIASDPDSKYYYYAPSSEDLDSIYGAIHEHISHLAARDAVSTEILADSLDYVAGSFSITPITVSGDTAVWDLGNLNIGDSWAVSFNITASDTGHLPVDDHPNAEVTYLNYLGESDSEPFPQRYIDVLPPTGVEEEMDRVQGRTAFLRATPNPFSSFSAIHYSLPHSARAELEIYNLAGELVRGLVAERQPAGSHVAAWDARDDLGEEVPSGIYLLRLRAGDFASTQKLIFIR